MSFIIMLAVVQSLFTPGPVIIMFTHFPVRAGATNENRAASSSSEARRLINYFSPLEMRSHEEFQNKQSNIWPAELGSSVNNVNLNNLIPYRSKARDYQMHRRADQARHKISFSVKKAVVDPCHAQILKVK